jgi:hypothetical protein
MQCCGSGMIFFGSVSGTGTDFQTVSDPIPVPDSDPAKSSGCDQIRIHNTAAMRVKDLGCGL